MHLPKMPPFINRDRWESYRITHPIRAVLPFLAVSALVLGSALLISKCSLCYAVRTDGVSVAFVGSPTTYEAAVLQAESKASEILESEYTFEEGAFSIRPSLAPREEVEDVSQVADSLMETIPELEHIYVLTVDGVQIGQAWDSEILEEAIEEVKDIYVTGDTRTIRIENQVAIRQEYLKAEEGVTEKDDIVAALQERVLYTEPYTVQEGDTVEGIMEKFSVTQDWLQSKNPDVDLTLYEPTEKELGSLLYDEGTHLPTGMVLNVEYLSPRLVVTTLSDETSQREIIPERKVQLDSKMYAGEERILEEGVAGEETVLARVERRCGLCIVSNDLEVQVIKEATPMVVAVGGKATPGLPEDCTFIWPVRGPISSDYGYRFIFGENNFHRGVDIAVASGTPICAAFGGTVEFVGVRGTYGNLVIINHHNGFYTYYGHCSAFVAEAGEVVTQGQAIALVGSTGRSTGPHCHFEVRYGGSPIDPLLYLTGSDGERMRNQLTPVEMTLRSATEDTAPRSATENTDAQNSRESNPAETTVPDTMSKTEEPVDVVTGASIDPLEEETPPPADIPVDPATEDASIPDEEASGTAPEEECTEEESFVWEDPYDQ